MASISSPGVGSGIDIGGLVAQLVEAQSAPAALRIEFGETQAQAEITALGALKSALEVFQTSLSGLGSASTYQSRKATSSNEEVFGASADADAVSGSFELEVVSLARSQKLSSVGVVDPGAPFGSGSLTISMGGSSFGVNVASGGDSLEAIRDAINDAPNNPGVSATIISVDDGVGGSHSKLVLAAGETGTDNEITILVNDADGVDDDASGLSRLAYDPAGSGAANLSVLQSAVDAQLRLGTETITRSSNVIDDAIEGVSIELVAVSEPGETTTLAIAADDDAVRSAVESLVKSYSGLTTVLGSLSSYDQQTDEAGVLLGDAMLRGVQRSLRRELGAEVAGLDDAVSSLAAIGITTRDDGTLEVDTARLNAVIETDRTSLETLLAAPGTGLAARLDAALEPFTQTSGVIDSRTDGLNRRLSDFADQRAALERRVTSLEGRLLAQFIAMDTLVGSLQSTSTFITQQFDAIRALTTRPASGDR
jgi:flagellar hook-associated protein 2